ncbi:MAG: hypothetical protein GAK30_03691 [Paracidovorax wautersii]|uniref:Acyl-CoA dehydrogenase/oxidase C-terminal domain-containing protein n=1 Tax=Paracidovorax wautersii TaxID=1177982 RepID=A0A7V8JNN3_9BURK|nr:MAG: hypothetical protein GAK30_03691 [Paracidovorax wautersii]
MSRNCATGPDPASAIARLLDRQTNLSPLQGLQALVRERLGVLPLPGGGQTLVRWRALACVGAHDLALAKLYEAHTDALAILHELAAAGMSDDEEAALWGVWCAEPPHARLQCLAEPPAAPGQPVRLRGRKPWCSGAQGLSHALVSCWDPQGHARLAAVRLRQPGVHITDQGWSAVGMAGAASVDVVFDDAAAHLVGEPGGYLARPGFLHGGAGVAACWYGAAAQLARRLLQHVGRRGQGEPARMDPHALAHLGAVDVGLHAAASALRDAADVIDARSHDSCALETARARLAVEAVATDVVERAGRALGAGPLCREADVARRMADLPVFIRQSHAERDQAAHGERLASTASGMNGDGTWTL